jgi:NAD(P)-dependent dehydrogenase (short-subunit alcohol dehydrogenase family)
VSDSPVAIITGAGSGIGQAASLLLAEARWRLALVGRTKSSLALTAERVRQASIGSRTIEIVADVGEPGAAAVIVEQVFNEWGRIDALVNNAAALVVRPIEELDETSLTSTFATNLFGPARLVAATWPTFAHQRSGVVVNISSMATVDPFPGLGAYAASKAALESLTRSIMAEGRTLGIRAFSIAPGAVETAMLRSAFPMATLPSALTLKPSDVAAVVAECMSGTRDPDLGKVILVPSPQRPM